MELYVRTRMESCLAISRRPTADEREIESEECRFTVDRLFVAVGPTSCC
jgi:hypothetical protein